MIFCVTGLVLCSFLSLAAHFLRKLIYLQKIDFYKELFFSSNALTQAFAIDPLSKDQ
jgi:hypothetical protein